MASPSRRRCVPCPRQRTLARRPARRNAKPRRRRPFRQNRCASPFPGTYGVCGCPRREAQETGDSPGRSAPVPVGVWSASVSSVSGGVPSTPPRWARHVFSTATMCSTCSSLTGVVADCGPSSSRTSCGWIYIVALPSGVVLLSDRHGGDRSSPQQPCEAFTRDGFRHPDRARPVAAALVEDGSDHVGDEVDLIGVGGHESGDQVVSTLHRWLSHISPGPGGVGSWT